MERHGRDLPVIGQHEQVVPMLLRSTNDPGEASNAPVDTPKGAEGLPMARPELVGGHVVVDEVHVEGRHARVEVDGHAEREELAEPAADEEAHRHPAERRHAVSQAEAPEHPARPNQELPDGDDRHPHDQPRHHETGHQKRPNAHSPPEGVGPEEVGEGEDRVVGAAPEHAAVGATPAENALPPLSVGRLHGGGVPGAREPPVGPTPLVEKLEGRNVDGTAVHQPGLERRRRGRQPRGDRVETEGAGAEQPREGRHASLRATASRSTSWEHPQIWITTKRRVGAVGVGGIRAQRATASSRPEATRSAESHRRAGLAIDPILRARPAPGNDRLAPL